MEEMLYDNPRISNNNMYNQTQLIMISRRLFPNKNIFNLNKQEQL